MKTGFVALIGRPNVGKSTFLNTILEKKVSIVTPVPQTTRYKIRGIYTDNRGQIIFIDTPGFYKPQHFLGKTLFNFMKDSLKEVDLVLYMTDVTRPVGEEELKIMKMIINENKKTIMALNKVDRGTGFSNDYIEYWNKLTKDCKKNPLLFFVPISALNNKNLDKIIDIIFEKLEEGTLLYPQDMVSDLPKEIAFSDIIREKLYMFLKDELPHSIGVNIEEMKEKNENLMYVKAIIYVEKPSHKKIVIGKDGRILKEAGKLARKELEAIIGKKVYLDLWVKVKEDWPNKPYFLRELGYES